MAKIVVLDDQPDICESIQIRLEVDGHDVQVAHTGDEAIDLGYLFQPDILIVDWYLESEYDGFEVAEAYSVANKQVKTILITGRSMREAQEQAKAHSVFHAIAKPFSMNELVKVVDDALQSRENDEIASSGLPE